MGSPGNKKLGHNVRRNRKFLCETFCGNLCRFPGSFSLSLFLSLYRPGWYVKIFHTLNPHALNRSGLGFIFGATVMQLIRTREQSFFTALVHYVLPLGLNSPDKTTINIRSGRCYTVKNNDTLTPAVF